MTTTAYDAMLKCHFSREPKMKRLQMNLVYSLLGKRVQVMARVRVWMQESRIKVEAKSRKGGFSGMSKAHPINLFVAMAPGVLNPHNRGMSVPSSQLSRRD